MNFKHFFKKNTVQLVPYKEAMPEYVYHATFKHKLDSILRYGLLPRNELDPSNFNYINPKLTPGIYLTDSPQNALKVIKGADETAVNKREGDTYVIKINSSYLDSSKIFVDPNYEWKYDPKGFFHTWLYQGQISPKAFETHVEESVLQRVPQFLFHISDRSNLRSIQKHGLRAERDYILSGEHWDKPGVNLVSKHKYPFPFRPERSFKVKVDTSKLDLSKLTRWSWWYRYWDSIPPELLTFEL